MTAKTGHVEPRREDCRCSNPWDGKWCPACLAHLAAHPAPIKVRMPSRLEVHFARSADPTTITGVRWDLEVHGYVVDVENNEPTRVRSCGVYAEKPTNEEVLALLKVWFEHEMREQLDMDPHGVKR